MIVQTIGENEFVESFKVSSRADDFSVGALRVLFNYYDDFSDDMGEPFEMDIVAISCEWSELTRAEIYGDYSHLVEPFEIEEEYREENGIDTMTDIVDDTYEKFFVESLDEKTQDDLDERIIDEIIDALESSTTIYKVDEDNYLIPAF